MKKKSIVSIVIATSLLLAMLTPVSAETTITYSETVAVNLINNSVISGKTLFTQDHKTNNDYDYDIVQLIKYTISDIDELSGITLDLGSIYYSNPATTLLQVWIANNEWSKDGTDFSSVSSSSQTLIYQQNEVVSTGGAGTYTPAPLIFSKYAIKKMKLLADNSGTITLLVRAVSTKQWTSTHPHIVIKGSPALSAQYSAQATSEPITTNCTDRLYVDLLNNTVSNSIAMFTQDHTTDDTYDTDKVMLARFQINNIQAVSSIAFNVLFWSDKKGVSKVQLYLADNSWTSSDTSFTSVKNGAQTLLFTSDLIENYDRDGYYVIPVNLSREQVLAIKSRADENGYFTILFRGICTSQRNDNGAGILSGYTLSNPNKAKYKTTVTYASQATKFYGQKQVSVSGINPIHVDKSNPTQAVSLVSAYGSGGKNMLYLRTGSGATNSILFMTFDLSGIDKSRIESANMSTFVYANGGNQYIKVSEVTTPYNEDNGTYTLDEANSVNSSTIAKQNKDPNSVTTVDLTEIVKKTDGNTLTLCIESGTGFIGDQVISVSSTYFQSPKLSIEYLEELENLNSVSDYDTIIAERNIVAGSEGNIINVKPIIAAYNNQGTVLSAINIGDTMTLDGTYKLANATLDANKLNNHSDLSLKFFVWDDQLRPYGNVGEIDNSANGGVYIEGVYPKRIYTVTNDSDNSERNYSLSTYVDYLYNIDTGILFKGERDRFDYPVITKGMQSNNTENTEVELPLRSDKYYLGENKVVTQTNTLMSKEMSSPIRLLCIGDSITAGYGTDVTYWQYVQELFWKESIDLNDTTRKIMTLGTNYIGKNTKISQTLTYEGITETLKGYGEGRGGWMVSNYLYHDTVYTGTKAEHYASMGGTEEFSNTVSQRDYVHSHTLVTPNTAAETDNVFYDYSKDGDVKFSIRKWLERYRTHDADGNPLELGNGTGTLINENNINKYVVCEPTHILIQLGTNDFSYYSEAVFRENLWKLVSEIKKELPNVVVIISMAPPSLGTYNAALYENCQAPMPTGEAWYRNAAYLNEYFDEYNEEENKIYLLPTYFVTPTVEAYNPSITGPTLHATAQGHFKWAYQLYSLLKYMQ